MRNLSRISIIVLNYNGRRHLDDCFSSLMALDYPQSHLELVFVDNASKDKSVDHMRRHFPQVRVIANGANVGFSAGNNVAAREATGDYAVFLNNDMRVASGFVKGLLSAIESGPRVRCTGAKILSWDGSSVDFGASAAHFAGYAYQLGYGEPLTPARFSQVEPILFACGGAMMVDRQLFLDIGGFDEDYFMFYEDLDLGWRLWLLGHEVVFAPDAIVHHRHHGSVDRVAAFRRQVLYKRNALYTVLKNYDDRALAQVLPATVLGSVAAVVQSASRQGRLKLSEFDITTSAAPSGNEVALDRHEASTLVALHDVVKNLPRMTAKRQFVQDRRQRSDSEVVPLLRRPFRYWPDVDPEIQFQLADAFHVQHLFEGLPRRVLVISSDILPYPGLPTVGSGLRAWGLGHGLRSCGHDVVFSMPRAALRGREALITPDVAELAWDTFTLGDVVRKVDPDIVVVCNWPVLANLPSELLGIPVVLDQHGPHLLEREYQRAGDPEENVATKLLALRKADFFTCAGHKQWHYFQSWLEQAGWSAEERQERSAAVPVSLSPGLPEHVFPADVTFVYGGVFLPWQDPAVSLSVLAEMLDRRREGKLYFYGGRHPVYKVDVGIFERLLNELEKNARVVAPGMVSHDELIDRYTHAHVAIDIMRRNPERELAFTTRTVEYLWCGLPVMYNDYSELSEYIREYDAGWTVTPDDREGIGRILNEIFDQPERVIEKSRNAQRLVRERLTWDRTITPIDSFVRNPRMREHDKTAGVSTRAVPHLLRRAWATYRRDGSRATWRKGAAYLRRQASR